jgi:2,4-dienoyl-CoA reductase-like NADH-dependent reductase (Old Yellow Enzyme family)
MKKGVGPSPIPRTSPDGKQNFASVPEGTADIEIPRELSLAEIEAIPGEYRNCAKMAQEAGFDGVEIHSSNGFLLNTFLQSCSNERTDEYGGSFENRFRLIDKVLQAVCEIFPSYRVAIRLSPNGGYNCMGSADNKDAFLYYIKRIAEMNLGYLHLTNGIGPLHGLCDPLEFSEIRGVYSGTVIANAEYTAELAEKEITSGYVDAISFGRPFISNPDLARRFAKCAPLNDTADSRLRCVVVNSGKRLGRSRVHRL